MEYAFELPCAMPDLSPLDHAIVGLDPAALVDVDAGGRTLRMATVLTRDELLSCMQEAGLQADAERLRQLPSMCCGGCSG
ncbi:hypothetical protein FNZ56_05295 [Pseudoluteimonas lycopersici]|uniref:Uncharacterized protein n=1 Tax=Pseudoluteimonas lycopersici TaxID=1324796 RepID=A0A516V488_9GAMM|nr:hypothetical protein [Lysobacter lycopersici]QDQ73324.1 hypothetical protein FNZ56_05295 [Lysobacter lycopersici]